MASLVPRLAPGSIFAGRYRVLAYVGQGSMGSVYSAEAVEGGALVALKLVKLDSADGRAARRFEREAESGQRIQSPHVARALDAGKLGDGLGWLAMEYAPGPSFEELVRTRRGLELAEARLVLSQLFAAVAAAHAVGIVHRDLKPDNVRVSEQEGTLHVKVLDFGIAKDFAVSTLSGTTPGLGTPLWTAPEQTREGYQPVPSADVWALGLLAFFGLTGGLYWRHTAPTASLADLALELLRGEIAPASQRAAELGLPRELPRGFDAWFERAVSRDVTRRFVDAAEAWAALEPLLKAPPPVASRSHRVSVAPGIFLSAVIAGVLLMGLAIYWLLRSMRI
ncbi:MAG: serine/threonine protein kinase [Myxococcales bacterium]|nr:MAG: serine/threonine protein kinase [Myxococcales bacterium]